MTTPQVPPPDEPVPLSRLMIWAATGVVLVLGVWLYIRFGRAVTPLTNA